MHNDIRLLNKHFYLFFFLTFIIACGLLLLYRIQNEEVYDRRDYSQDKNVEDNFVLPSQENDKFLHYNEHNRISVVNYFSLDCPYCRKLFFEEKEFVKEYGDKVNFIFREKPISFHALSFEKALVKECIYIYSNKSDEKYFQFVEDVFKNYEIKKLGSSHAKLWEYVYQYISKETLDLCLKDENLKTKILGFKAQADASQIFWTPTIVVFKDGVEIERIEKVWPEIYKKVLKRVTESTL